MYVSNSVSKEANNYETSFVIQAKYENVETRKLRCTEKWLVV